MNGHTMWNLEAQAVKKHVRILYGLSCCVLSLCILCLYTNLNLSIENWLNTTVDHYNCFIFKICTMYILEQHYRYCNLYHCMFKALFEVYYCTSLGVGICVSLIFFYFYLFIPLHVLLICFGTLVHKWESLI